MDRLSVPAALAVFAALAPAGVVARPAGQSPSALRGHWALNRQLSEFPKEIGFGADILSGSAGDTGRSSSRGGRGRASSAGGAGGFLGRRESPDDAARLRLLTEEVRNPPAQLTIDESQSEVTIKDDKGRSRTFHPGSREDVNRLDDVPVAATAKWDAGRLIVVYDVEEGRQLRYTYSSTTNPPSLVVDVQFIERGGHDSVRRVYEPAIPTANTASDASPADGTLQTRPAGAPASSERPAPAVDQSPDADLKGLTRLGVVVEDVGSVAAGCGLTRTALENAASSAFADAGLTVVQRSDEDTYLYVNVMASRLSSGTCVSRYDVSLLTHTTAALSYGKAPVLTEVLLLHKGGMAGGPPAANAEAVVKGVGAYAGEFAARVRGANR